MFLFKIVRINLLNYHVYKNGIFQMINYLTNIAYETNEWGRTNRYGNIYTYPKLIKKN